MGALKEKLIYINGEYFREADAKISVYDHGLLYGDGVFEGIRAYGGRVFKLEEHIDRLFRSADIISLMIPKSKEEIKEAVLEVLKKQGLRDSYIRLIVTRGIGDLTLDPTRCRKSSIIIIAEPMVTLYERPARAIVASIRRNLPEALSPNIKSLNYLNNILAKIEAIKAGVDEAIMLDNRGFIAEGTGDNIFIVKDGKLITPTTANILPGITRSVVIELAREEGIPVEEKDITVHDLYTADEAFLTGTAAEIAPLVEVDGRKIGDGKPGPITLKLKSAFKKLVKRVRNSD